MNQLAVIDSNTIAEINSEHELAQQASKTAVEHGSRVGALLLQVKESLPHGDFGLWLAENVDVSDRQARRYMRHAKGLPLLRTIGKSDTVSVLDYDPESFAKIVANAVAEQMAIERAKMIEEFEREKQPQKTELDLLAERVNENLVLFEQNRSAFISELVELKAFHKGMYWQKLVSTHYDKLIAEVLLDDLNPMDKDCAVIMTDSIHAKLVAQIEGIELLRNITDWTVFEFESFDDFVEKNSIDLDHFERYQQMPIYSEIVESIKAFNESVKTQ